MRYIKSVFIIIILCFMAKSVFCFAVSESPGFLFVKDYLKTLKYFQKNTDRVESIFPEDYANRSIFLEDALKNTTLAVRSVKKSIKLLAKYAESGDLKIKAVSKTIVSAYSKHLVLYQEIMDFQYKCSREIDKFDAEQYLFKMKEFKKRNLDIWETVLYGPLLISHVLVDSNNLKITPEEQLMLIEQIDKDAFESSIEEDKKEAKTKPEICRESIRQFLVSGYKIKIKKK